MTKIGQLVGAGRAVGLVPQQFTGRVYPEQQVAVALVQGFNSGSGQIAPGRVSQGKHLAVYIPVGRKVIGRIPVNRRLGKNRAGQQAQQQREQGFHMAKSYLPLVSGESQK